jgi:hypothetical protein
MLKQLYIRTRGYFFNLPLTTWVLLGFFITFLSFFVAPIFFDPSKRMQFTRYLPALAPIGNDFRINVFNSFSWLHAKALFGFVYPSFTLIFFSPFTLLDYGTAYKTIVSIILLCYVLVTLAFPIWINKQRDLPALSMLIFVTGLVSYGMQFELERGQFNVIALAFCLGSIYIFHNHPGRRWLAYLFFTISIQLKLYPAMFVFTLIEDWSDWKGNIKRIVGLGFLNIAALFILGWDLVLTAIKDINGFQAALPGRVYSLSILSFSMRILSIGFLSAPGFSWLQANSWLAQFLLFSFFGFCFLIIIRQAYKLNSKGFNPCVFFACMIGACIIPGLSYDYKLSLLPASVVLLIPVLRYTEQGRNKFIIIILTLLFSIAYSSTLYPYVSKPGIFQYNFPALMIMLVICTIVSFVRTGELAEPLSNGPQFNSDDR